jgi:predicted nucleotidyltransferase
MIQPEIIHEINQFCLSTQEGHGHSVDESDDIFVCIYGSSVYKPEISTSDIDFLVAGSTERISQIDTQDLAAFVTELHIREGKEIDTEVPYCNKLTYSFDFLNRALMYEGFSQNGDGHLYVPRVVKTTEFLGSQAIKLRLAANALTTPHIILPEESRFYQRYVKLFEICMTLLGIDISGEDSFSAADVRRALVVNEHGEEGEMYLGYKVDQEMVEVRLRMFIVRALTTLLKDGYLKRVTDKKFTLKDACAPMDIMGGYIHEVQKS